VKYILRLSVLLALLLLASPALAQGRAIVEDTTSQVDTAQVERAAQALTAKGATVVVLVSDQTGGDPQAYAQRRLSASGIQTSPLEPSVIVYLVALDQRNVFIYYGADYNASLGPTYKNIADQEMIPQFARGDITGGIVAGINGTVEAIDNPPGSGTNINVGSGVFTPIVLGAIFLVLLFVVGPIAWRGLSKRRAAAQALAKARQDAEAARKQAGAAIADFGQALREAREKAQFDEVSYPAADVRQLAELQAAAETQFVAAQEAFDQAGERLAQKREPTQPDLVASAGAYRAVTESVAAARHAVDLLLRRQPGMPS
jgi:uncharacterized membrane protein YgcG